MKCSIYIDSSMFALKMLKISYTLEVNKKILQN